MSQHRLYSLITLTELLKTWIMEISCKSTLTNDFTITVK